jgi:NADH:ubiquinone oxidoreductase subunit 6 (subunit J)
MIAGMERPLFYIFSAMMLLSGLYVVASRNLVRCAFALLFTFLGIAGLYALLGADFVAAAQVLIYIGGILILIIFGVMLTHRVFEVKVFAPASQVLAGALVSIGIFLLIRKAVLVTAWRIKPEAFAPTTDAIGRALMGDYLLQFEVASVLLLFALIGAVVIGRRE